MPIRWDALLARHVAAELDASLAGARLRAARFDGERRDLVLLFREHTLLWRLHPSRGWPRLLAPTEPVASDLPLKAALLGVESVRDDRVIRFRLAPADARGRSLAVVVELLGNQWNALVTEEAMEEPSDSGEVVRHVLWRRDTEGAHRVGSPHRAPAPLGRRGVEGDVALADWLAALAPLEQGERRAALVRAFAWTSPLNAAALLGAPDRDGGPSGLELGHERWVRMATADAHAEPVVLETDAGPQPYPFPLAGTPHRPADSLLAAFDHCAGEAEAAELASPADTGGAGSPAAPALAVDPALLRRLEREGRRAARRVGRLERELAELEEPDALRQAADLILARYGDIPRGATSARLVDFEGGTVDVELDPAQPAHENAARYYARAAKAERARDQLPALIDEARAQERRIAELLEAAQRGTASPEGVATALGPAPPVVRGQVAGPALPYKAFRSSGGLEIRVGRGASHNDDLTFHHSAPGDVWMHARHTAGAHVILRWQGEGRPPARDLEEAATLAALHSKARTSGSVPVDWTLRRYVRKPRRSPPGQVLAERVETLFVEPDEALLERLSRPAPP